MFTKWSKLKEDLKVANDDTLARYLLSTVEPVNRLLRCERFVLWTFKILSKASFSFNENRLDKPLEDLPSRPVLSSTPISVNKSQNRQDLACSQVKYSLREERFKVLHQLYLYQLFLTVIHTSNLVIVMMMMMIQLVFAIKINKGCL